VLINRSLPDIAWISCILFSLSSFQTTIADQVQEGPHNGLYGGYPTRHPFVNLPRVAGFVTVELRCRADLGCDGWDYSDCHDPSPSGCDIPPESKWVTLTIAGVAINDSLSYIGVPSPGDPPVPSDGRFFKNWHFENPDYPECGFSDCYNDEQHAQLANIHRFTVAQDQWNAWVMAGSGAIYMRVTSSPDTMNLPVYCAQHATGSTCCPAPEDDGTCQYRPGSNATIIINYTRSGRCCYPDANCEETSHDDCTAMGGVWTDGETCGTGACPSGACCNGASCTVTTEAGCVGGTWLWLRTCSPNPCSETPMGACCYGSGLCIVDTEAHCQSVGGAFRDAYRTCEPNRCPQPLNIIYVDAAATGTDSGTSWTNAYTSLQLALRDANDTVGGDQIWVAAGVYKPTSESDRTATFRLYADTALYGGFVSGAQSVLDRDPWAHPTTLSGDLLGNDNPADFPNGATYSENSYRVVTAIVDPNTASLDTALLDGFVITGGNANGTDSNVYSGGILIWNMHPSIRNCVIVRNSAGSSGYPGMGAGMHTLDCSPEVRNCVFLRNRTLAPTGNPDAPGGGARLYGVGSAKFVNCVFRSNTAVNQGGGVQVDSHATPRFVNCTFLGNSATSGGGAYSESGAIPTIVNTILWNDTGGEIAGGGVVTYSDIQGGYSGVGNINANPGLLDPNGPDGIAGTADDDLRLAAGSPCIDAADNSAVLRGVTRDLAYITRVLDDPDTLDTGNETCPIVDMGAYEFLWACEDDACLLGDGNQDGLVDGADIDAFVSCLVGATSPCDCHCFDMDLDGVTTVAADVPCFVQMLVRGTGCSDVDCEANTRGLLRPDCNENGIADALDMAYGLSMDCNHNFIPDECDIADNTSTDLNTDGIPDECQPDCNKNGVPDDKDIADCDPDDPNQVWCRDVNGNGIPDGCEPDCNGNGVPDAWDISQETSEDCNSNGVPDECELDCNDNGVPDACDITNQTSPDCNGNGRPDECDFTWPPPPFGSADCNDNGIPDECDIAACDPNDPNQVWCHDCNANGIPDGCDIAAAVSLDENENGIPDECEQEEMGGGGFEQESFLFGEELPDREALMQAWAEYFDWAFDQDWGQDSALFGAEQFQLMADKLQELGLPVRSYALPRRPASP
jgi:hypothetical protein